MHDLDLLLSEAQDAAAAMLVAQRFCSRDCRHDFHTACRIWAMRELEAGRLSLSALRRCAGLRIRCVQRDLASQCPRVQGDRGHA